jgi:ribosomal-protein-alanine N-acetyltransferase
VAKSAKAFPELSTRRLRLRRFEARDLAGLHACLGDLAAMRYWNFPVCKDEAETARWVRILGRTTSPHSYLAWAIAEKRGNRCIGLVNYHHRETHNRRIEIGYILQRTHYGKGFMTEALHAVLTHCIRKLGVHRVEAIIDPENAASIRVVERLGFRREGGPLRDYWWVGDRYRSPVIYGLIANELKPLRK